MKVLAIIGSPRKNGNTAAMVNTLCKGAATAEHETEVIYLTDLNIHDCIACDQCKTGKIEFCAINDDMQQLYKAIINADCIVFGTPVYMGQMTGQMKNFLDRWYTFVDENFTIHHVAGKKYITVTSSGAPAEIFGSLSEYFNHWLGNFFKMEAVENIMAGDLGPAGAIHGRPDLLIMAETIGHSLK